MRRLGLSPTAITLIESLYKQSESAVRVGQTVSSWFQSTVGVRQGCILSPSLFNVFLEELVSRALENFTGSISIGGRALCNLRFADDIDLMAGSKDELQDLTNRIVNASTCLGMEISTEKSKILITGASQDLSANILINREQLEEVDEFKYLGSIITNDQRCRREVLSRIASGSDALARLAPIWRDKNITLKSKLRLLESVILSIFLYACQTWTLTAELEKRIDAFEMRCLRRLLKVSYTEHRTNVSIREEVNAIHSQTPLIVLVRRRKLQYFGHIVRAGGLCLNVLQGCVAGGRARGRPRMSWLDNVLSWSGLDVHILYNIAHDRLAWRSLSYICAMTPRRP